MRDGGGRSSQTWYVGVVEAGGWSAASSVGVRDSLEAEGELDGTRVGRKACDGGGGTLLLPRPRTDSATVPIAPPSCSSGSTPEPTAERGGSLRGTGLD
jgi:hypothetical protein